MRAPTKIQLQPAPSHQWELHLPGLPFHVYVWDNGRWAITASRDTIAHGATKDADAAGVAAGNELLKWCAVILGDSKSSVPVEVEGKPVAKGPVKTGKK